jgi:uncharacterized membrane protein
LNVKEIAAMDTAARILTKALTWQALGLISMTGIGYLFTGSFAAGGRIALVTTTLGFISYFLHELAWRNIGWGRQA